MAISISNVTGKAAISLTTGTAALLQYKDGDCAWGAEKGCKIIMTGGVAAGGPAVVTNNYIIWLKYLP